MNAHQIIVESVKTFGNKANTINAVKWMAKITGAKTAAEAENALVKLSQEEFEIALNAARKSGDSYKITDKNDPVEKLAFYVKYGINEKIKAL